MVTVESWKLIMFSFYRKFNNNNIIISLKNKNACEIQWNLNR